MAKLRKVHKNGYTVMDNGVFKSSLSLKARGLLSTMMSLPEAWHFSERGLAAMLPKDGRDSIRTGIKELEDAGYLTRERIRDDKGQIIDWAWVFSDYPQSGNPGLENPTLDNPGLENPTLENPTAYTSKQEQRKQESNKNPSITKQNNDHASLDEVKRFFQEKQLSFSPDDFYRSMEMRMWKDSNGEPVSNWKGFAVAWNSNELQSKELKQQVSIKENEKQTPPSVEWVMERYKVSKEFAQDMITEGLY